MQRSRYVVAVSCAAMTVGAAAELSVGGAVEGTTAACCCVSLTPLSYSVFSYYAA